MREFLGIYLRRAGHRVEAADGGKQAIDALVAREFDIVITDLRMQQTGGLEVLREAKKLRPDCQVVMVTAFATAETAIEAMKAGAYDYLTKPFKVDEVGLVVQRALERRTLKRENLTLRDEIKGRYKLERLVGKSEPMQRLFEMVQKIAPARTSVLLIGESGTGKELAARALHDLSPRAQKPFVAVNCGAIPETLIESELFGHVKGAFTGANADRPGLFESANGGTLLLDEIGELPLAMQVKLLRTLQEKTVKRVGGVRESPLDVRIVAATNRDLEAEVETGTFRQDLYYRLNVIQIRIPPLRERREDVPLLVDHFVRKFSAEHGRTISGVDPSALSNLIKHNFPGNVRELENIIERAVTLSPSDRLGVESFPEFRGTTVASHMNSPAKSLFGPEGIDLEKVVNDYERQLLLQALELTGGNRTEAARLLGVTFRSLRYRLSKLGITGPDVEGASKIPEHQGPSGMGQ